MLMTFESINSPVSSTKRERVSVIILYILPVDLIN